MTGDGTGGAILAGYNVGNGYIQYSGLTDIHFNIAENVIDNAIKYTAYQVILESPVCSDADGDDGPLDRVGR